MNRRARIIVTGFVQGVFYRASTVNEAQKYHLKGTVRNLRNGNVEIIVEGEEDQINKLIDWSKQGPPSAEVEKVDIHWDKFLDEFRDFQIIRL